VRTGFELARGNDGAKSSAVGGVLGKVGIRSESLQGRHNSPHTLYRATAKVAGVTAISSGHVRRYALNCDSFTVPLQPMSTPDPVKILVVAMTLLLAMPLSAQRYQERDHHVFHPPVQAKHQSLASSGSPTQTRISSAGNSSAARGHDANLNASRSNGTTHSQMPSSTDSVHPH
jgi:hypothetical protein